MGLDRLSQLLLKSNFLTHPPPLTSIRTSLVHLDLSWNEITHIPRSYFYQCCKLHTIMLTKNKLSEMPNMVFIASRLRVIGLAGNEIDDAVLFYGRKYPRLRDIDFDSNNLDKFCLPPPRSAPRLKEVRLFSNNLTTLKLPVGFHDTKLLLGENPWHCDGSLGWARECTHEGRLLLCPRYVDLDSFICYSPVNMSGMSPQQIGKKCYRSKPHDLKSMAWFLDRQPLITRGPFY